MKNESSFALFRLPDEKTPTLLIQEKTKPELLLEYTDLNNRSGFVVAPFRLTEKTPVVLIHPERELTDWKSIETCFDTGRLSPFFSSSRKNTDEREAYRRTFAVFMNALKSRQIDKLVLSRSVYQAFPDNFSPLRTFYKACHRYPNAFVYLCYTPQSGCWMGSSPELLLRRKHDVFQAVALAGTKKAESAISGWDDKNRTEQRIVADYFCNLLSNYAAEWEEGVTETVTAGNVVHLSTAFQFHYPQSERLGDLLAHFHPSPAVCGFPKEEAYRFIEKNEGYDREYYSGFIGQLSSTEEVNLYVNLRCMKIGANRLQLFAGSGLMVQSTEQSEWEETEEKLKTMQQIIENE